MQREEERLVVFRSNKNLVMVENDGYITRFCFFYQLSNAVSIRQKQTRLQFRAVECMGTWEDWYSWESDGL